MKNLFSWGCLALLSMCYYATQWATQPENPLRHEFMIGIGFGLLYGWPAWLGLPVLAFHGRKELGRLGVLVLLSPVVIALVVLAILETGNGQ